MPDTQMGFCCILPICENCFAVRRVKYTGAIVVWLHRCERIQLIQGWSLRWMMARSSKEQLYRLNSSGTVFQAHFSETTVDIEYRLTMVNPEDLICPSAEPNCFINLVHAYVDDFCVPRNYKHCLIKIHTERWLSKDQIWTTEHNWTSSLVVVYLLGEYVWILTKCHQMQLFKLRWQRKDKVRQKVKQQIQFWIVHLSWHWMECNVSMKGCELFNGG